MHETALFGIIKLKSHDVIVKVPVKETKTDSKEAWVEKPFQEFHLVKLEYATRFDNVVDVYKKELLNVTLVPVDSKDKGKEIE